VEDFMALEEKDYKSIEDYLKNNLARIISEQSLAKPPVVYEIELRERMVRVEEELKNQRELMNRGFDMMDKRFEDMQKYMDKRFEQVERRFEQVERRFEQIDKRFDEVNKRLFQFMIWSFGLTVSAAGVIIAVMKM
jgi:flagellar capping protein FliD